MIATIDKKLELEQSPEAVWSALTDPAQVASWFGETAEFKAELGGEGYFGWQSHGRFALRIEEFDPPNRLTWRWGREANKSLDETHSTVVEWILFPRRDGGTTLLLKESGFATEESRQENVGGWEHELGELVELLGSA
jgi:uncharacterized protein YndB with AHSA1/START domain